MTVYFLKLLKVNLCAKFFMLQKYYYLRQNYKSFVTILCVAISHKYPSHRFDQHELLRQQYAQPLQAVLLLSPQDKHSSVYHTG